MCTSASRRTVASTVSNSKATNDYTDVGCCIIYLAVDTSGMSDAIRLSLVGDDSSATHQVGVIFDPSVIE